MSRTDLKRCTKLLRGGSRTFYAASHLLPKGVRDPATALYAFCRVADDAVDDGGGVAALDEIRDRLDDIYNGVRLDEVTDRAFSYVVSEYGIPKEVPLALLEGFEWDVKGREYHTLADVRAYGARVAGSVGIMMAFVMGVRTEGLFARAAELGVAMQLSNIARDVGEDARLSRVYLPQNWLTQAGLNVEQWLDNPAYNEVVANSVERLLAEAETLYRQSRLGVDGLPLRCRFGINAAATMYREIGREVARNQFDSVSQRAVVSGARKSTVLLSSTLPAIAKRPVNVEVLPEVVFLVNAAMEGIPTKAKYASVERVLEVFERLERRDRMVSTNQLAGFG